MEAFSRFFELSARASDPIASSLQSHLQDPEKIKATFAEQLQSQLQQSLHEWIAKSLKDTGDKEQTFREFVAMLHQAIERLLN